MRKRPKPPTLLIALDTKHREMLEELARYEDLSFADVIRRLIRAERTRLRSKLEVTETTLSKAG